MANENCINQGNCRTPQFLMLLGAGGLVVLGTLFAFFTLEHHGHVLTGMNNQVVWGLPHVFAVFLIVGSLLTDIAYSFADPRVRLGR